MVKSLHEFVQFLPFFYYYITFRKDTRCDFKFLSCWDLFCSLIDCIAYRMFYMLKKKLCILQLLDRMFCYVHLIWAIISLWSFSCWVFHLDHPFTCPVAYFSLTSEVRFSQYSSISWWFLSALFYPTLASKVFAKTLLSL